MPLRLPLVLLLPPLPRLLLLHQRLLLQLLLLPRHCSTRLLLQLEISEPANDFRLMTLIRAQYCIYLPRH